MRGSKRSHIAARWSGASVITIATLLVGSAASAQNAAPQTGAIEEIVITGFRQSLEEAINLKRNSAAQVDSILAEDIGKFPDLNLSESLQRIPGVVITRDGGEGRQVAVRGLSATFTRVRINGMEALTTAGGTDAAGGTNRGRSFDFNVFASDLFNRLSVRKTAEANVEEGSLGATVDLRTGRPFDYKGLTAVASVQGSYNDLASEFSPRASALISNTWADDTLGAAASISYTKRKLVDVGTSTVRWARGSAFAPGFESAPAGGAPTLAEVNAAFHPRFPRFDQYIDDQERIGGTVSLQWKPSDKTLVTLDGLYADFKGTREEQFLEAPSFSTGGACTTANRPTTCGIADTNVVAGVINSSNTLVSGTFNDVDLRVEDRFDKLDTEFMQFSLDGTHELTDDLKVHLLAGHSVSDHDNPIQTTITLDQFNVQNYQYDYSTGRVPLLSYGSANLTNPASWTLTQIRLRPQRATSLYDTVKTDLTYAVTEAFTVDAGFDFKRYSFKTKELRRSNGTTTNQEPVIPAALLAIPLSGYTKVNNFESSGLGAPSGSVTSWLLPDINKAAELLSIYSPTAYGGAFRLGPESALGNTRAVREKDVGGYVQGSFEMTAFGDMPLRGNFGTRYVRTSLESRGFTFVGGAPVPITVNHSYQDFLPSLNMALEPGEHWVLRFAAARVMARPDLPNLTPGSTISVSGANRTVTAGNPRLKPFRSNDWDLSFEYYPDKGTLLAFALFRKDVNTFVQTLTTTVPFTGNPFGLPDSVAISACGVTAGCSPSANWAFSTPINTPGGTVQGFEFTYQQPFRFLPDFLSNTGAIFNYTGVGSKIRYLNAAGALAAVNNLTNLSPNAYNATLYYEDDKISTRITAAYRAKYLTRVPGQEAGTDVDGTNHTFNLDFSFQYSWDDHLKFSFEAVNLTDQFQDQFNDSTNRLSFYHHTGREFLLGIRYTY